MESNQQSLVATSAVTLFGKSASAPLSMQSHDVPATDETEASSNCSFTEEDDMICDTDPSFPSSTFLGFRVQYLLVTLVVMLADGLQGTHLYVLYEGYGFSVASLYCLGFVTGAVTTPITGPLIDKLGRKKSALLYCALEMGINWLEQYPFLVGLVISRMVGGITTNLLSSVFETWLDSEYRRRGFDQKKYEIIMRDSVVISNMAAIASGYLAHLLAEHSGPVGPFKGAVSCTAVAMLVIFTCWTENYGCVETEKDGATSSVHGLLKEAVSAFRRDSRVLRVGIIQGLTMGSIQIFIFLWSPTLQRLAQVATSNVLGLDSKGEPAYGLIFGAFMTAGVIGGLSSPIFRKVFAALMSPSNPTTKTKLNPADLDDDSDTRPVAVEFLASVCYILCAVLLLVPCLASESSQFSFTVCLGAFLVYEFLVGISLTCEGVIRSLYIPSDARATMLTLPRIIVNLAVSLGVASTNFVSLKFAYGSIAFLMTVAAILQLSLLTTTEWDIIFGRINGIRKLSQLPFQTALVSIKRACISLIPILPIARPSKVPLADLFHNVFPWCQPELLTLNTVDQCPGKAKYQ